LAIFDDSFPVLGEAIGVGRGIAEIDGEIVARDHFADFFPVFEGQRHRRFSPSL
jgi:hypothetical protein